jgi:AAA+ ATPase superfamily predicted ATPase
METLIGRHKEQRLLREHYKSNRAEFVAIYGRRRVGKTFLVRQVFEQNFAFHITGMAGVSLSRQLGNFHAQINKFSGGMFEQAPAKDWFMAFQQLIKWLESIAGEEKKVVFIDELPWLDTRNAGFLSGLEHFWNSWASARKDVLLIVCGSAASWMLKNLIHNRGGLHNRLTDRIKLDPFTLQETEAFLRHRGIAYDRYQVVQVYMALGGIPYYLERIRVGYSPIQNINALCFERNAIFRDEYSNLYASIFHKPERHIAIIEALAKKAKGMKREELLAHLGIAGGGSTTRVLQELEESDFIRRYRTYGKKEKDATYQLVDLYTLFYLKFIAKSDPDDELFWINAIESPMYSAWSGYAFEMVCLHHVREIKRALGISGVQSSVYAWAADDAQIDLVIDRKDQVINLFEIKFSIRPFAIDKPYSDVLRNKIGSFRQHTGTSKALFLSFLSTFGLVSNTYSHIAQNNLTMDVLFGDVVP